MVARATRATETTAPKRVVKIGVGLALLVVLGFLFLRSVRGTRAEPYTVAREDLRPWTLTIVSGARPNEAVLLLRPPPELMSGLFGQLFKRAMESMGEPGLPGIPLVLQAELTRAQAGHPTLTPETLMAAAREAGLDSLSPQPVCIGHRRTTTGGDRQQLYFAIFEAPAFGSFRQRLAAQWNDGVAPPAAFDPALVSPALIVAMIESSVERWLPLHADPKVDCVAPIVVSGN
jgi:hypothetical protein